MRFIVYQNNKKIIFSLIGITITEFINFESLLLASDSLYRLAFQLFDRQGQGSITFDDFRYIISATKQFKEFPFNFDSDFVQMHFGVKRQRQITYKEFTQILLGKKENLNHLNSIHKKTTNYLFQILLMNKQFKHFVNWINQIWVIYH